MFESTSQSSTPARPVGRKLAVGVVGLLVLAFIGTLAAAQMLGGDHGETPNGAGSAKAGSASAPADPSPAGPRVAMLTADQVRIVAPKGDRVGTEFQDVGNLIDGKQSTAWKTDGYKTDPHFGNIKPGLGVLLNLKTPQQVVSVQVDFTTAGATAELRTGTNDPGSSSAGDTQLVSEFTVVGTPKQDMATTALFPGPDRPTRYLLVWLTTLPPDGKGRYRISISEITVRVQ